MTDSTPPAAPETSPAPLPSTDTPPRPQYEFDENQNRLINYLASSMMWVTIPMILIGIAHIAMAITLAFRVGRDGAHLFAVLGYIIAAILSFVFAYWLRKAAEAFFKITKTAGSDISHLMVGLRNLASYFGLIAFIVQIYLFLLGLLVLFMIVGLVFGAFRGPTPTPQPAEPVPVEATAWHFVPSASS
jgi:hypothetical protein